MVNEFKTGAASRPETSYDPFYHVSWSGIFAGTLISLVLYLALGSLGVGLGLGAGAGAGIWMVFSSVISLFVGGWVSSWASEYTVPVKGILQGVFTWSLVSIVAFYLMATSVGAISGILGITGIVSSTALWGFFMMGLSLIAAGLGGMVGVSKHIPIAKYEEKETRRAA